MSPSAVQPCPFAGKKKTWIEIALVGADGKPVPEAEYCILLPDGSKREGKLDSSGQVRVDGIDPGSCVVTFPGYDRDSWKPK